MKLIADSGSTKTHWLVFDGKNTEKHFFTCGINPVHVSLDDIQKTITGDLLPEISALKDAIQEVHFYGAGCTSALSPKVGDVLSAAFPLAGSVCVASDMLGAARGLLGRSAGIACILGTGAGSCVYDGAGIARTLPSLGYILGDEGSGAVLGREFLKALLRGELGEETSVDFQRKYDMTAADILQNVYKKPLANRFLASFAPFVHGHLADESVRSLVQEHFKRFFQALVLPYQRPDLRLSIIGSVAFYFQDDVRKAASSFGLEVDKIAQDPISGLQRFHC